MIFCLLIGCGLAETICGGFVSLEYLWQITVVILIKVEKEDTLDILLSLNLVKA